jgi:hypothetical protein
VEGVRRGSHRFPHRCSRSWPSDHSATIILIWRKIQQINWTLAHLWRPAKQNSASGRCSLVCVCGTSVRPLLLLGWTFPVAHHCSLPCGTLPMTKLQRTCRGLARKSDEALLELENNRNSRWRPRRCSQQAAVARKSPDAWGFPRSPEGPARASCFHFACRPASIDESVRFTRAGNDHLRYTDVWEVWSSGDSFFTWMCQRSGRLELNSRCWWNNNYTLRLKIFALIDLRFTFGHSSYSKKLWKSYLFC